MSFCRLVMNFEQRYEVLKLINSWYILPEAEIRFPGIQANHVMFMVAGTEAGGVEFPTIVPLPRRRHHLGSKSSSCAMMKEEEI